MNEELPDPLEPREIEAEEPEESEVARSGPLVSRRRLLQAGAAGVAGTAVGGLLAGGSAAALEAEAKRPAKLPLRFFSDAEHALVEAMAERIFPTDRHGPGARVAGVASYIDGQLDAQWGRGEYWYMQGPFIQPEDSGHGWQIPMRPRDVYKASLPAVDDYAKKNFGGKAFTELNPAQQTTIMLDLSAGKVPIPVSGGLTGFSSTTFFAMFRQNVLEGMFADPLYGGNRNMVGWKWLGFPGNPMAQGNDYNKWVGKYNTPYPFEKKPKPLK